MIFKLKNCSLFQQLIVPMFVVGFVSICSTIYSASELQQSVAALGDNFRIRDARLRTLEEMETSIAYYRTLSLKHLIAESSEKIMELEQRLKSTKIEIYRHYNRESADSLHTTPTHSDSIDILNDHLKQYFSEIETSLIYSADFEKEMAFDVWSKAENHLMPGIKKSIKSLIRREFSDIQSSREVLMRAAAKNLHITMSLGIGSGVLLLLIAFFVTRRITRRLGKLLSWSQGFSAGSSTFNLERDSFDEVGRLTSAMDDMAKKIHRAHRELADAKHDAEEKANELRIYAKAFENSGEAIVITDRENNILNVNTAFMKQTGYQFHEVVGKDPRFLSSGRTSKATYREMWTHLNENNFWQGELWDRRKSGDVYPKWVAISAIRNTKNEVLFYIASFIDISERKETEERIEYLAHHDILTGALNRFALEDRMQQALAMAARRDERLAVFFIDLDRFKSINDNLGHHIGDKVLVEVAARLKLQTRKSDILARIGGDEFIVVLTGMMDTHFVAYTAEKIRNDLSRTYEVEGRELEVTPSIGISLFPDDGNDADELIKTADVAMFHAKGAGQGDFSFYTDSMLSDARERIELEHDISSSLLDNHFELYYQPQIRASDNKIFRFEALARWPHPSRGMVAPDVFIPVAEETGLIHQLGEWVLDQACSQIAEWRAQFPYLITVSVNLSAKQLQSDSLVTMLKSTMAKHDIRQGELELEITETAAMHDPILGVERLTALRELGVTLAIDDFGTGYSSLAYLKRLPIQLLKLDRVFVRDIEYQGNDAKICAATLALAHSLGLKVVAEGVENNLQRDFLINHDCDFFQGFLFSKPLPAKKAAVFIMENSQQMKHAQSALSSEFS